MGGANAPPSGVRVRAGPASRGAGLVAGAEPSTEPLSHRIRENPSARRTEELRADPRLAWLSAEARAGFVAEYEALMTSRSAPSRDALLERARPIDEEVRAEAESRAKLRADLDGLDRADADLAAEVEAHNARVEAFDKDLKRHEAEVAEFQRQDADLATRVADYEAQTKAHNSEVASYTSQCVGAPLPPAAYARCNSWGATLNARKATLDAWMARLTEEVTALRERAAALNASAEALQKRSDQINTGKADLDGRLGTLAKRRLELGEEQKKLDERRSLLATKLEEETRGVDAWRALLDPFNVRLARALEQAEAPTPAGSRFVGSWKDEDKRTVGAAVGGVRDAEVRSWIVRTADLDRYTADTVSPVSANGSTLRFRDGFFDRATTRATRENLLAFEAGKVCWSVLQDKVLPDGRTVAAWFAGYAADHSAAIGAMRAAPHRDENLTRYADVVDTPSAFGHAFRAQALQLTRPPNAGTQEAWNNAMKDFRDHVAPLLRERP
jgi:predicted  nucleic acid-binding Zn-ribbon protein